MTNDQHNLSALAEGETFKLGRLHCKILTTADGSASLCYGDSFESLTEPMHSSKGAWSETLSIYEPALRRSLEFISDDASHWCVASIGLGLGYNEILSVGLAMQKRLAPESLLITSFESRSELRSAFKDYFRHPSKVFDTSPLSLVYLDILKRVAASCDIDVSSLSARVSALMQTSRLIINGPLTLKSLSESQQNPQNTCILFDAFSPASSPDLWTEDILAALTDSLAAPQCVFTSYASRTVLKRVLKLRGFKLEKRIGFAGKRESTFAIRQ